MVRNQGAFTWNYKEWRRGNEHDKEQTLLVRKSSERQVWRGVTRHPYREDREVLNRVRFRKEVPSKNRSNPEGDPSGFW